jgi:predicted transcriptional regulator
MVTIMEKLNITVSNTEKELLEVLWQKAPMSANEITSAIQVSKDMHPSTIKTLLNRLVKKEAIGFNEKKRKYYYFPLIEKSVFYQTETDNFLQRFFNGQVSSLMSYFAEKESLSKEERQQLQSLIKKMDQDNE